MEKIIYKINENKTRVIENPVILQNLCTIRDKDTNSQEIRIATRKITRALLYEASYSLPLVEKTVNTPLTSFKAQTIDPDINIIISPILRAGLIFTDEERVPVRDLKTILETLSLQIKINKNPDYLTEQTRRALSRSICKQNLADTGELLAITLAPDVENIIAQGVSPDGQNLTLDPEFTRKLIDNMNIELEKAISSTGNQPVLLCSSPIRIAFRKLIERTYPQITIMSYNEISSNTKARSIGVIKVTPENALQK